MLDTDSGQSKPFKALAKQFEKNLTAARLVDVEQRKVRRLKTPCPVLGTIILMAGLISTQMRFVRQMLYKRIIHWFERLRYLLCCFVQQASRKRQLHHFLTELLDGRKGHTTAAFHKSNHGGDASSQQISLLHIRGQWCDMNSPRLGIKVLPGTVLGNKIQFLRECDLLHHPPFIQGYQTNRILGDQFVLDHFVNLFRLNLPI